MPPVEIFVAVVLVRLTFLPVLSISTWVSTLLLSSTTVPAEFVTSRDVAEMTPACVSPAVFSLNESPWMPPAEIFVAAEFVRVISLPVLSISTLVSALLLSSTTVPAEFVTSRDVAVITPVCVSPAVFSLTVLA